MLLKEYQKVLKFLNLRAPVSIQVPFLLILPKSQVHCWFVLSWVAKPSYQGVLGSLIWSAETSTHGIKLGSVTREERSKRHYYFPLLRLKVSLEIKAQIVMIPKAGDTVKKKKKYQTQQELDILPQKTFLHHLIPLSTWVAQGCLKRSRDDLECVPTQSTHYGLKIKV